MEKQDISVSEDAKELEEVLSTYTADPEAERRLLRSIDRRIVPASMVIYLLCSLDRSNIGNAKILNSNTGHSLLQSLNMSNQQYLVALMIFYVSYTVFETPSNYMLKKFRPSRWIAFLMFAWGAMTMILGGVHNFGGLIAVRFLLGVFEAGLFPGMVYVLTFWYRPEERALRIALILASATLGGAFGGAIAYGVGKLDSAHGIEAWRYLFIIEGAPSCAGAVLVWFFFPDYPETVRWLSVGQRELAVARLKGVASLGHYRITWEEAKETLRDYRLYVHYLTYITISVPFSSMSLFSPTIVAGLGYEGLNAQLFTVPPYAIAFVITVAVAWVSDRYEVRALGCSISMFIAGACFVVEGALPAESFKLRYAFFIIALSFAFACIPPLLSWLTANLRSTGASTLAVPLNVSIGQIGQIIGVYIYKANESPGYPTGHYTNAGFLLVGGLAVLGLRVLYVRRNKRLEPGARQWRL
ncbi:MFS transporter [Dichomitus squalens]|uniref:MFS transporter n=2 Tax=Dichomitus squalens TaxID=114155 RepID=A0A4Q9Q120_9APHY|nr:MFS transporter [Dichomitus squalens LYAD-421 SS1]EJF62083.1 MFS transporter [Dichomitus squalens LYAD-421 SS1]TBU45373.1 MFS transporter [Dichomitus squalens]TBU60244.1 MFS transporter [Dichomitus squalens]